MRKRRRKKTEEEEEKERQRIAKRLWYNYQNETVWNEGLPESTGTIMCQFSGDSLTAINWLKGKWHTQNNTYHKMLCKTHEAMEEWCVKYPVRPPNWGDDLWRHIYREGNEEADLLTWRARESPSRHYMYKDIKTLQNKETLAALRGHFDGGKSESGSAVGFWLQGLIVDRESRTSEWRTLQETGTLLEHDASAMETEFLAALQLFAAAREATTKMIGT